MEHFALLAQKFWIGEDREFWKVEMAIENHEFFGILEDEKDHQLTLAVP